MASVREVLGLALSKIFSIPVTLAIFLFLALLLWSNVERSSWVRLQFYVYESTSDSSSDSSTSSITTTSLEDVDENVYSLEFWNVFTMLWDDDLYYLAIVVLFFSLLLTYIKMFLVMIGLWVPMTWLTRAKLLSILIQLGKVALAIVFLIVFYVEATKQEIEAVVDVTSNSSTTEYDLYFYVTIELDWGLILFSLAIIALMLVTELVAYLNKRHASRAVAAPADPNEFSVNNASYNPYAMDSAGAPTSGAPGWEPVDRGCCPCCPDSLVLRAPILFSVFSKCDDGCWAFLLASVERLVMGSILALFCICLIASYSTECVKIEYTGDVADYMSDPTRSYSFRDFGVISSDDTDYKSYATIVAIIYELFVVCAPLLILCFLLLLWLVPLPNFIHVRLRPAIWYLNAWAMLDVMLAVALGTGLSYQDLYEMIVDDYIGDYCDALEDYIGTCADVEVTLEDGMYWALVAIVSMWVSVCYAVYWTDPNYKWNFEEFAEGVGPDLRYNEVSDVRGSVSGSGASAGTMSMSQGGASRTGTREGPMGTDQEQESLIAQV